MKDTYYKDKLKEFRCEKHEVEVVEQLFLSFMKRKDYEKIIEVLSFYNTKEADKLLSYAKLDSNLDIKEKDVHDYIRIFKMRNSKKQYIWPLSRLILDNVTNLARIRLIDNLKDGMFGNDEATNKKWFVIENLPLFSILDYAYEKADFELFFQTSMKIEPEYLQLYFDLDKEQIKKFIKESKDDKKYLLFSFLPKESFDEYFDIEDIDQLPFDILKTFFTYDKINKEDVLKKDFSSYMEKLSYEEQVEFLQILIGYDYPSSFIKKLRSKLKLNITTYSNLPFYEIKKMFEEVLSSSYLKDKPKDIEMLRELQEIFKYSKIDALKEKDYYGYLLDLHMKAKEYATSSIVSSIYDVSSLINDVTYMKEDNYNILVRVKTFWDGEDLNKSFDFRSFAGFSIITQNNFSHYEGPLLMGYKTGITKDMIAHIYPMDSLSNSYAKYNVDLTKQHNMLYDIDTLNKETLSRKTYNQLCIKTKDCDGNILKADCAICTDESKLEETMKEASKDNLKVLVLKKGANTIEYNEDIYGKLK